MSKHYPNIIFWLIVMFVFACLMIGYLSKKNEMLTEDYYNLLDEKVELQNTVNMYEWFNSTERRFPDDL